MGTHSGGITLEALPPGATLSDKLRLAASKGQINEVQELYRAGAVFDFDRDGRSALHYAALNGYLGVTQFLLERGCPIDVQDASGYTALHRAASQGHLEVITILLEAGCNPNTQDEHGNAAIHEAAWNGFSKTLELLVKHNVNVVAANKAGFSALHLAAQNGHNESSRVLLYAGLNNDHKNNYGDTALHTAARYGHAGVTRILISARAKMNEPNKNGDTALHIAAALKRRKIAKLLVESGVDVNVKNKQNETAMDVAIRKEHSEIITIIQTFTRATVPKPRPKEVNFKEELYEIDGPVVVPDQELPGKQDTKQDKGKRFFFFKKKKTKEKEKQSGVKGQQKAGPVEKSGPVSKTPVRGFFSQYVPRPGEQYYRDLAGNIKRGPIGYSPTCHCMPSIQRLEQHVNDARENVYDRIQSTKEAMNDRIDQVDHRSSMRVHALEQYTKERFTQEEVLCHDRINQRTGQGGYVEGGDRMKLQIQDWLEQKLEDYGHCLNHHHDDSALPNDNIFTHIQETANGRLFRSRSDETLSQSDNYSGHFRKKDFYESRQAAMQQIRAWQVPQYSRDRNKVRIQQGQSRKSGRGQQQETGQQNQRQRLQQHNVHQSQQNMQQTQQYNHQSQNSMQQQYHQLNHQNHPTHPHNGPQTHHQQQRHFPIEANVEIRNSAKNLHIRSSTRSIPDKQSTNDQTYMTMSGIQNQGAIPKDMSRSQSWQNTQVRKNSSSRGPVTHSTPKSRESSPFEHSGKVVRSQTDSGISRHTASSQNSQVRQQIFSDSKQDVISEQNDLKTSSSFMQSELNLGSSQNSDKLQSLRKPTFTTFGYDETANDGRAAPANSPEQNVQNVNSDTVYRVHSDILPVRSKSCSSPRSNNSGEKVDNKDSPRTFSRQGSQASYGFVPSNKDDLHVSSPATQFSVLRQKTWSTDQLLTDSSLSNDSARIRLFSRSQSEDRVIDNVNATFQHSSPRSSSESRGAVNSSVLSGSSANSSHPPEYSTSKLASKHSSSYIQAVNTPTDLQKSYISSARAGSHLQQGGNSEYFQQGSNSEYFHTQMHTGTEKLDNQASQYPYASMHEVPRGGTRNYPGPMNYNSGNNGRRQSDAIYSTVRDVRIQKDNNHNLTVTADVHGSDHNVYCSHDSLNGQIASLEPRSQTAYQTYLTGPELHCSKENLFQRESSPNVCNNSKEDSSSNPDSGYSSKIYGTRVGSVNPASSNSTPSSSFSTDRGISTPSNNNSPHSAYADYERIPSQQYQDEVQSHVQGWYKRKLQEATQRCYDNWKTETSPRKLRQNGEGNHPARNYGNDDYAQISQHVRPGYETRSYGENEYAKISQTGRNYGDDYAQISYFTEQNQYGSQGQYGGQGPITNGYGIHGNGSHLISTYSRGSDV